MLKIPFADFWAVYPRRVAKEKAEKAWNRLPQKSRNLAIAHLACKPFANTETKFIPYPTTYIHGKRWEDEHPQDPFEEWLKREEDSDNVIEGAFKREH